MKIDLSLKNKILYEGCEIKEIGGRLTLITSPNEAVNIVGRNITRLIDELPHNAREKVILTGPMAVWSYLVVFHCVVHRFSKVYYEDGRNPPVLIAQH